MTNTDTDVKRAITLMAEYIPAVQLRTLLNRAREDNHQNYHHIQIWSRWQRNTKTFINRTEYMYLQALKQQQQDRYNG